MILDAQEKVVADRAKKEAPAPVVVEPEVVEDDDNEPDNSTIDAELAAEAARLAAENDAEAEAFLQEQAALKAAAASGDLAAAISTETPQE